MSEIPVAASVGDTDRTPDYSVVSSTERFKGKIVTMRTDRLRMPDGTESDRDIIAHPGAVAIVALDDDDRVVMVRQFRQPVGQTLEELPAGLLDVEGESAYDAARRELYEEAALRADQWHVLADLHSSPGMTDEAVRIYLAQGLTDVAQQERHTPEHEEVTMTMRRVPLPAAVEAALSGELTNSAAVAGVLATAAAKASGWSSLRKADAEWPARPGR